MPKELQKLVGFVLCAQFISLSAADGNSVRGRVILDGKAPPESAYKVSEQAAREGAPVKTKRFLVGDENGLANVVVKVNGRVSGGPWIPPAEPLVITADKYRFEPLVSAIQAGQKVSLKNLDPIWHDFHVIPRIGSGANWTLDSSFPPKTIEFEGPTNFVTLRCPEHPWMTSSIHVLDNPFFAVTDKNGRFEIKGLPPGKYSIEADHANSEKKVVDFEVDSKNEEIVIRIQPKQQRTAFQPSRQK